MPRQTAAVTLLATACLLPLAGCVVSSHNSTRFTGNKVTPQSFDHLVANETTEEEMLQVMGTPSRTMASDTGGTIYVWEYQKRHESHGAVLLLFGGSTEREEQESASVLVRDGIVRSWWRD